MDVAHEAAMIALLVLRTILGGQDVHAGCRVFDDASTSEIATDSEAAKRIASATAPLALGGSIEDGVLGVRISPPSDEMLAFLNARKARSLGDAEYFGVVPRRCLGPGQTIQIVGSETIVVSSEALVRMETTYFLTPNYSLSGDEPQERVPGSSVCWVVRISLGAEIRA